MRILTRWLLGAWIVLLPLDGVIRFLCTSMSLPWLAYTKDVLLVVLLGIFAIQMAGQLRVHLVVLALACVIGYGALVGFLSGSSAAAVFFGAKMFLPFVVGYLAMAHEYLDSTYFTRLYRWVTPWVVFGVVIDWFVQMPWSGLSYDFGGATLEMSRQWTTFGLERPAGLGRSSFETAIALFMLLLLRHATPGATAKSRGVFATVYDGVLAVSSIGAIALTTSKTSILALCFLGLAFLLRAGMRHTWPLVARTFKVALTALMASALLVTLTPFLIPTDTTSQLDDALSEYGLVPKLMFQSLVERAQDVWPRAAHTMSSTLVSITGRGLGGVGAPQLYFAPAQYNPADNLHVYLWLAFGLVVMLALLAYLILLLGRLARTSIPDPPLVAFLATLLAFGATLNVIEAPLLMLGLGVLLAAHENGWKLGH